MKTVSKITNSKLIKRAITLLPILAALVVLPLSQANAQEYKKIKRLGGSQAICRGGVNTADELQAYYASNPDAMRNVLAASGLSHVADDALAAIAAGNFSENAYPVGTRFAWMGARESRGSSNFVSLPYREWAGAKAVDSFQLNVSSGCTVYHFAIPKICCNMALVSTRPDDSEACQPKPVAAPAPAPEPQPVVAAAEPSPVLALIPFIGAFVGSETRPRYEEAWDMDMIDTSGLYGLRAGLIKELSPKVNLFGQLSYYERDGVNFYNTYPEDNIALDIGLERKLSDKAFIGGGIGAWNVDDSDYRDMSLFGHVGGDIGASALQWFLEGRVFDTDSHEDSLSDNKMLSAGLRYLIK